MRDLTIQKLLILLVAIPTMAFVVVSAYVLYGLWQDLTMAKQLSSKTHLFASISDLQSSIQKERDFASAYLGGGKELLDYQLQTQEVDKQLSLLHPQIQLTGFTKQSKQNFIAAMDDLSQLREILGAAGSSVESIDKDAEEIILDYSSAIQSLLGFEKAITTSVTLAGSGKFLSSISILEQTKNNMGKLQGMMTGILAADESIDADLVALLVNFKAGVDVGLQSPALIISEEGVAKLLESRKSKHWEVVTDVYDVVLEQAEDGEFGVQTKLYLDSSNKLIDSLQDVIKLEISLIQDKASVIQEENVKLLFTGISVLTVLTLIIILLGFIISRMVIRPIKTLEQEIIAIEENSDLTLSASCQTRNEIGSMARAFNSMLAKFRNIILQVTSSTEQVASASEEMSAVTVKTSDGVSQQQSEVAQVATAMNEMSATVAEVANSAELAAETANTMNEEAVEGRRIVHQAVSAIGTLATEVGTASEVIHKLAEDSETIGSVLDVIRGIAEQTNLLALNAAIEAARAGEQGRGFAVVADEVRVLAKRTQESTTEIQNMIESLQTGSQNAVVVMEKGQSAAKNSVDQAVLAGESFDSIAAAVSSITGMNTQIASAAEEQTAVAEEINRNITNISQVADEGVESAQQIAESSEELSKLATELQGLVAIFKA